MKIAVTGASGFIGTEVLEKLKDIPQVEVVAITRNTKRLEDENTNCCWKQTDFSVTDLRRIFQDVDVVIHLASVRGTAGMISDYHINEIITENVLIAMGEEKVKSIIFLSSIAVYSDVKNMPWRENSMIEPKTLYGISKASCEFLCKYYSKKYVFAYSIIRAAQVLGLGEKKKGMMNVFIESACKHKQLHVMGKSVAKRQYIYVKDLAAIIGKIATRVERKSEIINVGMERAYTNLEIAKVVNNVFENDDSIDYDTSMHEKIESSKMNVQYLITELGYRPIDMEQALIEVREEIKRYGEKVQ